MATYDEVIFRIDATIEYAMDNLDAWHDGMRRSTRMYPARGGDIVALWNEFVSMFQAPPSNDWRIFTIADFGKWLRDRTLPAKEVIAARRLKQHPTGKVDLADQKQRILAERMAKVEAARSELPDMNDIEAMKAQESRQEINLAMQKDGPGIPDAKLNNTDLSWGDEPKIPSNVIAPSDDEDPLAGL